VTNFQRLTSEGDTFLDSGKKHFCRQTARLAEITRCQLDTLIKEKLFSFFFQTSTTGGQR
jgi:hypothetical protein